MHINAVANSVMLCLRHDSYNTVFKIKHKLYIASWSALSRKNSGCAPEWKDVLWILVEIISECVFGRGKKIGHFCDRERRLDSDEGQYICVRLSTVLK
jgi:hypothetical protein